MHWPPEILDPLIDCMGEAVALLDESGRVLRANPALFALAGGTPGEWLGSTLGGLFPAAEDGARLQGALSRALTEGLADGEARGERRNGAALWLRYRVTRLPGSPERSSAAPAPCLLFVAEEVTGQVERQFAEQFSRRLLEEACRREAALTRLNRELAALNELAATMNRSLDLQTVLDAALDCSLDVTEARTGWVYLVAPADAELLELAAARGLPPEYTYRHRSARLRESMPGKAVLTGKPLVLYSLPADDELTPYLRQLEARCVAHIPLRNRDRTIGVLGIGSADIQKLSEGLVHFLTAVGHQVGLALENARLYEQVKQRAEVDPLTGLWNRQRFWELLEERQAISDPSSVPWVLMIDIDNFKQINDTYGHARGDQILREVAALLRRSVRGSDIAARFGGDEFVVALCEDGRAPGGPGAGASALVERLRTQFDAANRSGTFSVPVTVSIGSARCGANSEHALQLADEAMYREKRHRQRAARRQEERGLTRLASNDR